VPPDCNYQLCMWSGNTHYDIVKEVARDTGNFLLIKYPNKPWDLAWWDGPIPM